MCLYDTQIHILLDLIFLKGSTEQDWSNQAKFIQKNLTDTDIDNAFKNLPKEAQDETIADIQRKLKLRKEKIDANAVEYYHILQEKVPLVGTLDKDKFVIVKNVF